jgi:26S proteasome regulatory subunit T4
MVKTASGSRYVVGCRPKIDRNKLKPGTRVTLDYNTYTIMKILPREVDSTVHNMLAEDPGAIKYGDVGGLTT